MVLLVNQVMLASNVIKIKTYFQDGQIGRMEYTIQINFWENLLNLFSRVCTLYDTIIKFCIIHYKQKYQPWNIITPTCNFLLVITFDIYISKLELNL